jgi:hypothetical protein
LVCWDNLLTEIDFSTLNSEKLTVLGLASNNFSGFNLSIFSPFTNLKELYVSNFYESKIKQNIYNNFSGSLKSLENLTKLANLNISNTDINGGLEYLPESVETLTCNVMPGEPNFQVGKICKQLAPCDNNVKI